MADPWTERNWTQKGREQAAKELKDRRMAEEAIRRGRITREEAVKGGLVPKPRTDTGGYEKPKPFWSARLG